MTRYIRVAGFAAIALLTAGSVLLGLGEVVNEVSPFINPAAAGFAVDRAGADSSASASAATASSSSSDVGEASTQQPEAADTSALGGANHLNQTGCHCTVCAHGNESEIWSVARERLSLTVQRGTLTNRKKKQKPIFNIVCNRQYLPGYPHLMRSPAGLRTPKVTSTFPTTLGFGKLFGKAESARRRAIARCGHNASGGLGTALFLGDSLTEGVLVQKKLHWPSQVSPETGVDAANSTSVQQLQTYWRVAMCLLEKWTPSKSRVVASHGDFWYRRAYAIGRAGITSADFNKDYLDELGMYLDPARNKAGPVTFVSYFLGTNDMLKHAENTHNGSAEFSQNLRRTLTAVRSRYSGPIVLGTIPFGADPGRPSGVWTSRRVWYNWALGGINNAVAAAAEEFGCGVAHYHDVLFRWRKGIPFVDGVHSIWWAHRVMALELVQAYDRAIDVLPRKTMCAPPP